MLINRDKQLLPTCTTADTENCTVVTVECGDNGEAGGDHRWDNWGIISIAWQWL